MLPTHGSVWIGALCEAFHDASGEKRIFTKSASSNVKKILGMQLYCFDIIFLKMFLFFLASTNTNTYTDREHSIVIDIIYTSYLLGSFDSDSI